MVSLILYSPFFRKYYFCIDTGLSYYCLIFSSRAFSGVINGTSSEYDAINFAFSNTSISFIVKNVNITEKINLFNLGKISITYFTFRFKVSIIQSDLVF